MNNNITLGSDSPVGDCLNTLISSSEYQCVISDNDGQEGHISLEDIVISLCNGHRLEEPVKGILNDNHRCEHTSKVSKRPWGFYITLIKANSFQTKIIYINPLQSISLQSHERRDEHWTVVSGKGIVILNDSSFDVQKGDGIEIVRNSKHRARNLSEDEGMIIIETQTGDYLEEDDIVRYEDDYGRATEHGSFRS